MVPLAYSLTVYHGGYDGQQHSHYGQRDAHVHPFCLPLHLQFLARQIHSPLLSAPFYVDANVVYPVAFVAVEHTVLQTGGQHMMLECLAEASFALIYAVIEHVHTHQMFEGMYASGHGVGLSEQPQCFLLAVQVEAYRCQREHSLQRVPLVGRVLHQVISLLVLVQGLLVIAVFLAERPEIDVAERLSQHILTLPVEPHRLLVALQSLFISPLAAVDGPQVGIVDGLAHSTSQLPLTLQCQVEDGVGPVQIAH